MDKKEIIKQTNRIYTYMKRRNFEPDVIFQSMIGRLFYIDKEDRDCIMDLQCNCHDAGRRMKDVLKYCRNLKEKFGVFVSYCIYKEKAINNIYHIWHPDLKKKDISKIKQITRINKEYM